EANAGAASIGAVDIGASQVWTNNSTSNLSFTSTILGTAVSGTQVLTISDQSTGTISLGGTIQDSPSGGALGLVVNGGVVALTHSNSFSGGFTLNSVTAKTTVGSGYGLSSSPLNLNGGALDLANASASISAYNTTVGGNVTLISDRTGN